MTDTEPKLMTVEEFCALPKPVGPFNYELHHGRLFPVARLNLGQSLIRHKLQLLLHDALVGRGPVMAEVPFRPLPEHQLWVARVGFITRGRFATIDLEDHLYGAPDLVIDILLPSQTASAMFERERMCLEHGCAQFWVVDPEGRTIRVSAQNTTVKTHGEGELVPLDLFGGASLMVDDVFRWDDPV